MVSFQLSELHLPQMTDVKLSQAHLIETLRQLIMPKTRPSYS